jgi:hypothetical protein
MILSGMLSTMNVWVDKYEDMRFSLNDVYMTLLMTGWMFFFMGIYYKDISIGILGAVLVFINVAFIRTQFLISESQYKMGMIPHHSMAVHMSKKLIEKPTTLRPFLENIIKTQTEEITFMKKHV